MDYFIIKRNGQKELFNKNKIINAINKAFAQVDGKVYEEDTAQEIADEIEQKIKNIKTITTVEEIQDWVEDSLMESERKDVARAYVRFRYKQEIVRNKYTDLMKAVQNKALASNVQNSNANVDEYSFGGRKFEAAGIVMKQLADETLLSPDIKKAKDENRIYIHDYDNYSVGCHNCSFIDFQYLFKHGFTTRNGDVRPPQSISTAMQQVAVIIQCQSQVQYGGTASGHIDFDLAPFVKKSFYKHFKDGLKYIDNSNEYNSPRFNDNLSINDYQYTSHNGKAYKYAMDMTERETMQAAQGLYHNLNTLESRPGSQLPFSSLNLGRDTSPEGRLVTKSLLTASLNGIGKFHKTSIFPILIFQHKKGVNANPGDPNYDLKQLAIKSLCKRIYPNFVNCDFSGNIEDPNNPDTYMMTMGCRTMLFYDRHGFGYSKIGRGNVNPVTINLPKIGIKHGICLKNRDVADMEGFYKELDEVLILCEKSLIERYKWICSQSPKAAPFLYNNQTMRGFDGTTVESIMKHCTQSIGFLGLAETCQALFGKDHTDKEVRKKAVKIVEHIYNFTKEASERNNLNFSCYFTPAEGCCYTICQKTKEEFGVIPNVTDKEFFSNSVHCPVWAELSPFDKIDYESEFSKFGTAGQILYIESDSKGIKNLTAIEQLINYAMNKDVPYFAINFPIETCLNCGFSDDIPENCPKCGSSNIERLARVTGYLSTSVEHFNKGKQQEVSMRKKHKFQ